MKEEKEKVMAANTIVQLNCPVTMVVSRVLAAVQRELQLPNQSATLTRIILDWYMGKSTPNGHTGFPVE